VPVLLFQVVIDANALLLLAVFVNKLDRIAKLGALPLSLRQ